MKTKIVLVILAALLLIYMIGPQPDTPEYSFHLPEVPGVAIELEQYIQTKENRHHLKPGTEAEIIWASDSLKIRTEYSIVYLHGFSASHHEGHPLHRNLAQQIGCNLYLARLQEHGVDTTDALLNFTASGFYRSAQEALAIGRQIGKKVIILSTSTGGTAALKLAADFPEDVHALINLSQNVRINDAFAFMLNNPWGLQIARLAVGGDFRNINGGPEYAKYWHDRYRTESLVQLQELIETTMIPETFSKVRQPVFNGYYFVDEDEQDRVVKVSAILWMHDLLDTPDSLKIALPFPEVGNHVLASPIKSEDAEGIETAIVRFMTDVLGMKATGITNKNS